MSLHDSYFYTESIHNFFHLLADDNLKIIIINSLKYLVNNELVKVYGFVIMPNHLHLLWSILKKNGKETPSGSFSKYTAHEFRKYLKVNDLDLLSKFASKKTDRNHQFWKRDPLSIPLSSDDIFEQKLNYIHNNPVYEKWNLCSEPEEYRWSSARFYQDGIDEFNFLSHFHDE
jgi:putative transposase